MKLSLPTGAFLAIVIPQLLCGAPAPVPVEQLARAAAAVPLSSFLGLPSISSPRLSPDGTKIAFLFPLNGRMAIGLFDRKTNNAQLLLRGTDESIKFFVWKGNEHLVFEADYEGNESYFIGSTDLTGKKIRRIAESRGSLGYSWSAMYVASWLPTDPENIVVAGWPGPRLAKLNVVTGKREGLYMRPMDRLHQDYGHYVVDGNCQVRFLTVAEDKEQTLFYRDNNEANFVPVRHDRIEGTLEAWPLVSVAEDGKKIYVVDLETSEHGVLRLFDPAKRALGPPIFEPSDGEIEELIWNDDYTDLLGVAYEAEKLQYHWFDAAAGALHAKLSALFPGMAVKSVSRSRDGQVQLVWVGSDREPGTFFVLDRKAGSCAEFKRSREGIDAKLMRPMEPITYTARDGLLIHGYLTRPFLAAKGAVPVVVLPHGGPFEVRDSWGFDPEVQFLASRGYAVLQVNYRGSGGYGSDFVLKGRRQWGRGMQDDLTDGVKWVIQQGIADPKRIAIYGASYGGFAAMAGVTLTPELYCCAVNYVGVIDLEITGRPLGADAWLRSSDYDYRSDWIGATQEYRDATNPLRHIENIRVPTLHAYGRNDPRVDILQWERLESALRSHNKPYQIIIKEHAGHGFSSEADRISFYGALEQFLSAHLAPPPS